MRELGLRGRAGKLDTRSGRVNGTRAPRRAALGCALLAMAAASASACWPYRNAVRGSEGVPEVRGYLASAARAPARDEVVDTAPSLLWKRRIGRGTLGVPAVGERVSVLASVDRWLYAFDTRTGGTLWRRRGDSPFGAGPLVADGLVFTAGEGAYAKVAAYRLRDGRRRWQVSLGDVAAPLAYADGVVYGVSSAGFAFAIRASEGRTLWRREIGPTRASPVVTAGRVALVTLTDTLVVLDAARGTLVSRATLPTSAIAPPTLLDDSTLVLADPAGGLLAVAIPHGTVRWRVPTGLPVPGAAVLARDTIWALGSNCTLWRIPVATPTAPDSTRIPDCVTNTAPTVLRDGVLVASVRGDVILFDPRTRRRVFTRPVRGPLHNPPQVVAGQVLVAPAIGEVVSFR